MGEMEEKYFSQDPPQSRINSLKYLVHRNGSLDNVRKRLDNLIHDFIVKVPSIQGNTAVIHMNSSNSHNKSTSLVESRDPNYQVQRLIQKRLNKIRESKILKIPELNSYSNRNEVSRYEAASQVVMTCPAHIKESTNSIQHHLEYLFKQRSTREDRSRHKKSKSTVLPVLRQLPSFTAPLSSNLLGGVGFKNNLKELRESLVLSRCQQQKQQNCSNLQLRQESEQVQHKEQNLKHWLTEESPVRIKYKKQQSLLPRLVLPSINSNSKMDRNKSERMNFF